jgi:hypothetical protein
MKPALNFADVAPTPEAAALIGKSVDMLRYLAREDSTFPVPVKVSGVCFYRRADLVKWKREHIARKAK